MRHSHAESPAYLSSDFDRSLTERGRVVAHQQCIALRKGQYMPDLYISSPALRAMETIQIVHELLDFDLGIQTQEFLYEEYTTQTFIDFIHQLPSETSTVLIVGHNPSLSMIAYRLNPESIMSFSPGSIGVFSYEENWSDIEIGCTPATRFFSGL